MSNKTKVIGLILFGLGFIGLLAMLVSGHNLGVFDPKGVIASKERDLIYFTLLLSLIVVIPVFTMIAVFAWKFRESNTSAKYTPDWDSNKLLETIWWGIPIIIILVLSIVTWRSSHDLDPFRPIEAGAKPLRIQVVAMQWKWLFIYPDQNIASVNYFQIPEDTPINFEITSDAPMNSFWIPQLGGQIYAMAGMQTKLHLMADEKGTFRGSSANISGDGFAGMHFMVKSSSLEDYDQWVQQVKQSPDVLNQDTYAQLSVPSKNNPVAYFSARQEDLYDTIIMKYMHSGHFVTAEREGR